MNVFQPSHLPRRILVTAAMTLAAIVVIAAAVYAAAFLMLAPLMQ